MCLIAKMSLFNIIFHHEGNFVHDKFMFYRGGNDTIVNSQDSNRGSYFEFVSLVRDRGYDGFRLWSKIPGLDEGYFHFVDDKQAEEIVTHCLDNNVMVIYGLNTMLNTL